MKLLRSNKIVGYNISEALKNQEQNYEKKISELEVKFGKYEDRVKQLSHAAETQEKRLDKVASSILNAVDQKFSKD